MKTESDLKATLEDKTEQLEKQQVHSNFFPCNYIMLWLKVNFYMLDEFFSPLI